MRPKASAIEMFDSFTIPNGSAIFTATKIEPAPLNISFEMVGVDGDNQIVID